MVWNSSELSGEAVLLATAAWGGSAVCRLGNRAERPLPSAFRGFLSGSLFMGPHLLCELNICLGPAGFGIVGEDGFPEARGFGQADATGNHCLKDFLAEELAEVSLHLAGQIGAV